MQLPALSMEYPVKLGDLVNAFPDEIFEDILRRLPLAARCRSRCVCTKWKTLLSSNFSPLPSAQYTILSDQDEREAMFFCHAESKWFHVPCVPLSSSGPKWVVADVHEGFVCYLREDQQDWTGSPTHISLAVSNPAMQSFQILPSKPEWEEHGHIMTYTKLWVDRQSQTFKVIVIADPPITEVLDSCTARWDRFYIDCQHEFINFEYGRVEFFFWKNIAYMHCFNELDSPPQNARDMWYRYDGPRIFALDIEYGEWRWIEAEFPGRYCFPMQYTIVIREEEVLLVQICLEAGTEFLSVWKLLDEPSQYANFSLSRWEHMMAVSDMPAPNLAIHACRQIHFGDEYIFFVLDEHEWPENMTVPVYAKYTFATKAWTLTPFPMKVQWDRRGCFRSFEWKPSLDMEVKLHHREL